MVLINFNRCPDIVCAYVMAGTSKEIDHLEDLVVGGEENIKVDHK